MNSETKQCQNCKTEFCIEPEDFAFYEKMRVPAPTWCPECRIIRRFLWRNERTLYRRKCAATGKDIISMFDSLSPFVVYERNYWWSDQWDQTGEARDYDFSKPFFEQFCALLESQPLPNLANSNVINSEYGNHNHGAKNCYLVFASSENENVAYASGPVQCKDSYDLYLTLNVERGYEDITSSGLYAVAFAQDSDNSYNSKFLRSCLDVNESFGCVNLRSKTRHFFNQSRTKEQYEVEMTRIDLGSHATLSEYVQKFEEFSLCYPRRHAGLIKCVAVTGDNAINSKNCKSSFDLYGNVEESKFVIHAIDAKDSYDCYGVGVGAELMYEGVDNGLNAARNLFNVFTHTCRDVSYTYACHNSANLFGCVGLKKKSYCILNKQYSKEDYEKLLPRIIDHMHVMPYIDKKGVAYSWGEFFPPEISPFAYNESIAQEYFPLTPESAKSGGYRWKEAEKKDYGITKQSSDLPDHIDDVSDQILKEVIACTHKGDCIHQCMTAFKIIPEELRFYREMNFPLPRLCSNCRHYARLKKRNPFRLWQRKCQCWGEKSENGMYTNQTAHVHDKSPCPNEFETAHAPDRPDIIYCEPCYQNEIV